MPIKPMFGLECSVPGIVQFLHFFCLHEKNPCISSDLLYCTPKVYLASGTEPSNHGLARARFLSIPGFGEPGTLLVIQTDQQMTSTGSRTTFFPAHLQ